MGLSEIKADCKIHRERLLGMDLDALVLDPRKLAAFLKAELADNLYPLLEGSVDAIEEDVVAHVDELDDAVEELIDQSEDVLHPETAAQILGVFEICKIVCKELDSILPALKDEVRRRRLKELVKSARQGIEVVAEVVASITLDPEEEKPAEPTNDDAPPADDAPAADDDAAGEQP